MGLSDMIVFTFKNKLSGHELCLISEKNSVPASMTGWLEPLIVGLELEERRRMGRKERTIDGQLELNVYNLNLDRTSAKSPRV